MCESEMVRLGQVGNQSGLWVGHGRLGELKINWSNELEVVGCVGN